MKLIPVIDLLDGQVVHARMGQRHLYHPIRTPLSATYHPVDVVHGLLQLHPFKYLYIADLNAILGTGSNRSAISHLHQQYPQLQLWVDLGFAGPTALHAWQATGIGRAVIGSETLKTPAIFADASVAPASAPILSLDFKDTGFAGPDWLRLQSDLWPATIIAMSLPRVGSDLGPDYSLVRALISEAGPQKEVIAAGGARNASDLDRLASMGTAGVLLASALHAGRITSAELEAYADA